MERQIIVKASMDGAVIDKIQRECKRKGIDMLVASRMNERGSEEAWMGSLYY